MTWDVLPEDVHAQEPGGAVAFAAVTAERFGVRAGIVTSCGDDYPIGRVPIARSSWARVASAETSTFENRYDARGDRVQVLHRRGGDIAADDVPEAWCQPEMLFVGPLTQELPFDCLEWFRPRVSCVVPQGWLRSWDDPLPSVISVSTSPPRGISRGWDVCVISESEVEPETLDEWRSITSHLVVTKGREGATLYSEGNRQLTQIPSFAEHVEGAGTDTTGAGDVFAAAMLIRYAATGDATTAANYASLCASLSTRSPSWDAVQAPPPVDSYSTKG